jgi:hypothetical protein
VTGRFISICAAALLICGTALLPAQDKIALPGGSTNTRSAAVEYLYPEQVRVTAGKPTDVALHFRVATGMHINSHQPRQEELIPTVFSVPNGMGVKLLSVQYPQGENYALAQSPETKLSVYTGEFTLQSRIIAEAGNHLVEAKLRYQACDNNACMPPKTVTVAIDVIAK